MRDVITVLLALCCLSFVNSAGAACGNFPAGSVNVSAGEYFYCADPQWVSLKRNVVAGCSASESGQLTYSGGEHRFCDGTNWYSTYGSTAGACSAGQAGLTRYNSNKLQGCNGSDWYDMSGKPTIDFVDSKNIASNATNFSFTSVSLGTASFGRMILVGISGRSANNRTISSVTIAGEPGTELMDYRNGTSNCGFYIAPVPTGTSGTIAVSFSGGMARAGITVWSVTNVQSFTPVATATGASSANLNVQFEGLAAGSFYNHDGAGHAWTGLTESSEWLWTDAAARGGGSSDEISVTETRAISVATTLDRSALCTVSLR